MTLLAQVDLNTSAASQSSSFTLCGKEDTGEIPLTPRPPLVGTSELAAGLEAVALAPDGGAHAPALLFGDPFAEFVGPEFPANSLPQTLDSFVSAQHNAMGADKAALAMAALTCVAGAMHGETCVRMGDGWPEKPILWTALVGLPSTMKSPIIDKATDPLLRLDRQRDQLWRQQDAAWQQQSKVSGANPWPSPPKACA